MLHQTHVDNFRTKYHENFYAIFRIAIGLLFMEHGAQKLFGIWGMTQPVKIVSMFGLAGIIEFFCGLLIVLGLFTVPAVIITSLEMLYAFFTVHLPKSPVPLVSGGELALLYLAAFLYIFFNGPGKWSLDRKWCKDCKK